MIRIASLPPAAPAGVAAPATPVRGRDFGALLASGGTAPTASARPVGVIDPLLLQQVVSGDAARRDREAKRRCELLLVSLRDLQLRLLRGERAAPPDAGREEALPGGEDAADPGLSGLLRAIRLRRQVEFAKRGLD